MAFNLRRPPSFTPKYEAYPYQVDAVRAAMALPYVAIFHEQGLGKTKIAIDLMLFWLDEDAVDTVFVVTKKALVRNWVEELSTHSYVTPSVLSDNRRRNSVALNSPVLIYVLNYEVVSSNYELVRDFLGTCRVGAVLDESQKIKNPSSRVATCLHSVSAAFERKVILTGTPAANRPYDIWSQIKFLDDGRALGDSYASFKTQYDLPDRTEESQVSRYAQRLTSIMERIRDFSIRETKRTTGLQLPDKVIRTHFVALAPRQAAMYHSYRNSLAWELKGRLAAVADDAGVILKRLLRLVQCASNPGLIDDAYSECPGKLPELQALVERVIKSDEKAVIWTGFVANVDWLAARFSRYGPQRLHGKMTIERRNDSVRNFRSRAECRLLIATPAAAKEGLTLTAANHAIFYDRGFGLDDYLQAQDRIHRISQDRDCYVYNLMAKDTIDEWVDSLLNAKHQAAKLAHGDWSRKEFEEEFGRDLAGQLNDILGAGGKEGGVAG